MIPKFESSVVEFKSQWSTKNDGAAIKKTIVAFANSAGGDLYIGVADDGSIIGLDDVDQLEERLTCAIRDNIQPSLASFISTERLTVQGKIVLRVHVDQGAMKPYCLDPKDAGSIYVRMNNASYPASVDEIAEMVRTSNPIPFERRIAFEQDLTFESCRRFCMERGLEFDPKTNLSFGFWDKTKEAYTNLAYICSDQSDYTEVLMEFADDDKVQLLNSVRVTGSVFDLYEQASQFIARTNIAWMEKPHTGKAERVNHYLVDPRVILEALVNMLAHRDYSKKASNLIHISPVNIQFFSIGGLTEGLSLADVAERMSTDCRNPHLANLFSHLRLMENSGTGFRLIRSYYKGIDLSELLYVSDTSFTITLPRLRSNAFCDRPVFQDVLSVASVRGTVDRREVQEALGLTQTRTISLLNDMIRENFLEKTGGGRSTRYKIKGL